MHRIRSIWLVLASLALWLPACAHRPAGPSADPRELYSSACEIGEKSKAVEGSVWLKAKSKEASGQFPAAVEARAPDQLKLEVTNLLGGTEAVIMVDSQKYRIRSADKKVRNEEGYGSWGGIPLRWAPDLFLGRIPCPSPAEFERAKVSVTEKGGLSVEVPRSIRGGAEKFVYRFRKWGGEPWPEALRWERKGPLSASVEFKFDDPDDKTGSPRKWEARSPQGEVKVRWRDREVRL